MVTPLDQLLLGINPRTGRADHFINIARCVNGVKHVLLYTIHLSTHPLPLSYVSLSWESPELALAAVHILTLSCNSLRAAKEMSITIGNNKVLSFSIF